MLLNARGLGYKVGTNSQSLPFTSALYAASDLVVSYTPFGKACSTYRLFHEGI